MTITALPTAPNSVTRQPTFAADIDTFFAALGTFVTEVNAAAAAMNAIAAGTAVAIPYTFSTTTTDADPGAGILRLDNATQNASTTLRPDLVGSDGVTYTDVLELVDDSTSTVKSYVQLQSLADATKWLLFSVASMASPAGYRNITVTCVASSGANPFENGASLVMEVTRTGDKGDAGPIFSGTLAQLNTAVSDADVAQLGANTFTADQTYAENVAIVWDSALSADGKYSGPVEAGTSSVALAFGELCYRVTATSKWALAKGAAADVGTVVSTGRLGICVLAAGGADAATKMLMPGGYVRADALFDTFTVDAPVYMSAATAGKIVSAAPTGTTDFTVRKVGFAVDANTVYFFPSNDIITLA